MSQLTDSSDITEAVRAELEMLTPEQVCELLQVSKEWLYDQVEKRGLPVVRLGYRTLRFRASEVSTWIRNGLPEPVEPATSTARTDAPKPPVQRRPRKA